MSLTLVDQIFEFSENKIKVIGTPENPWFKGKDVAELLDYTDIDQAIRKNVRDKNKSNLKQILDISNPVCYTKLKGNEGSTIYINEAGFYQLIFKSKKKEAEQIQDWVFEKVLPEIRKTGSYQLNQQLQEKEKLLLESKEAYERQQQELEEAKQKNLNLRTIIKNTQIHDYDGYLYFVTNRQYSLENHYRLGRSGKFARRIAAYKNGRTKHDKLYYVFIFKTACVIALEHLFQHLLKPYRDEKGVDMYVLSWEILGPFAKRICEQFQTSFINPANELIQDNIMTERKTTIDNIPKEITPAEYNKFLENEEEIENNEEQVEDEEERDEEVNNVETLQDEDNIEGEEENNDEEIDNKIEPDEVQTKEDKQNDEIDDEIESDEVQTKEDKQNEEIDDEIEPDEESEKTIKTITNEVINRTVETIETTKTTTTQKLFKCSYCSEFKQYKYFGENAQTNNKRYKTCIDCRNRNNIELKVNIYDLVYKCLGCLNEKDLDEFKIDKERNERCNQCIEQNIPVQKFEALKSIIYRKCSHCKNRYDNSKFYIKNNGEISWVCLDCMKSKFESLVMPIKDKLLKTPRNYKSKLLQIIKSYVNDLTLHDIFGKTEIKDLENYRRCSGRHIHEIDRWQLIEEFALVHNGRGYHCRTTTCTKCRRS